MTEWKIEHDPATRRTKVLERDEGRCQQCGIDCRRVDKIAGKWTSWYTRANGRPRYPWKRQQRLEKLIIDWKPGRSFAEVDHIVPLAEGGTNAIDNLRTLCRRCHRAETAALRRRHSRRAGEADQTQLFGHKGKA